tara:strand:- start:345 stop:458 length:114 start_codon:yes stop_codon:yes gene_type:complete
MRPGGNHGVPVARTDGVALYAAEEQLFIARIKVELLR